MITNQPIQSFAAVAKAASTLSSQAMSLAIQQTYWSGVQAISGGGLLILFSLLLLLLVRKNWTTLCNSPYSTESGAVSVMLMLIMFVFGLLQFLDVQNWIAIFNPRLALFQHILHQSLGKR